MQNNEASTSVDTDVSETMHSIVAGRELEGQGGTTRAVDPATGAETGPEFTLLSSEQLVSATSAAEEAFDSYRKATPQQISDLLTAIAEQIENRGEDIVATAMTETGLPQARLQGELARTTNQLRLFANVALRGDHLGVRIEPALPERSPLPRPDLRQKRIPLGPVGVFGASNFPLAFSVAGGDTASALASGCPVVVKAHNAHPGTGHLVGEAVSAAVADQDVHPGVFSLVYGRGADIGQELVADPRIRAVGFTGSRSGGTALMATAAARPVPIPVYAEMSSVNPVFVLPSAIAEGSTAEELAKGFVTSLNGSAGQLCTAPGLIFVPTGNAGDEFVDCVAAEVATATGQTMLTPGICEARTQGADRLATSAGVNEVGRGTEGQTANAPAPAVFSTDVARFVGTPELSDEVFGAVCLIVRHDSDEELLSAAKNLVGELTATIHLSESDSADLERAAALAELLEQRVGRILFNGWPTGVDVGDAMVHGGPYPATSDGRSTSVGTAAIERFLRPVVFQNAPAPVLSAAIRDENPWSLTRRVDGVVTLADSAGDGGSDV
ncbi:aldehyde dehydrogenase (NADP(+)) [Brevibacterium sp.]|uniref:aldehyde dehydrogenase (NADP(+)) n=1 Tax=Brevibacterium sp. TaxID=1701 RepID=UPI00281127CF|nr:aldehyde dehydrogenase (NADP(+)) [Brevibacterium sp.]